MKYILIMWMITPAGVQMDHVEFNNRSLCVEALETFKQKSNHIHGFNGICVKK